MIWNEMTFIPKKAIYNGNLIIIWIQNYILSQHLDYYIELVFILPNKTMKLSFIYATNLYLKVNRANSWFILGYWKINFLAV